MSLCPLVHASYLYVLYLLPCHGVVEEEALKSTGRKRYKRNPSTAEAEAEAEAEAQALPVMAAILHTLSS
jgi:Na+-transporting methylmalonyl-CoA/oxaloacetate decarboxylase gamma subunit